MIGMNLSHFRITAKLGEGGMGEVYRATDTKLGREVAIKVLPAEMADDPERLERFTREAQTIAALNHPNIVTIYSVEEAEGQQLLTMELVDGRSLDQLLPADGFGTERLFRLAIQIADALAAAHEKGITHRDLKPANVMVNTEDRVKVLDFGLAKLANPEGDEVDTQLLTQDGVILGTVPYMSPEQVQGQAVDARSDIFSFGILLYEMATGRRPFQGDNPASVISSVLKDQPLPVTEVKQELPNHLGRIVRRCLEKSPQRRYQSARDIQLELEGLERELSMTETTWRAVHPDPPVASIESKRPTASWLPAMILGLAGLLLGTLGAWIFLRPGSSTPTAESIQHFDLMLDPPPSHWEMALSADGKTLLYSGSEPGGEPSIHVRQLTGFESRLVPGTEGGVVPFFSPDTSQLGFFSAGRLKRVSLLGGLPTVLCATSGAVTGAFWTDDDEIIYSTNMTVVPHRVDAVEGGEGRPLDVQGLEAGASLQAPRPLPGREDIILVTVEAPSLDGPHVAVLNLENGQWKPLMRGVDARYLDSGYLLFAQENHLVFAPFNIDNLEQTGPELAAPLAPLAVPHEATGIRGYTTLANDGTFIYPSGQFGLERLYRVDAAGRIEPLDIYGRYAVADPSGRRLLVWTWQDIVIVDLESGETTRLLTQPESWYPRWSADGERIFFSLLVDGRRGIHEVVIDGGDRREIVHLDEPLIPSSVSQDGTLMGYRAHAELNRDIWVLPPGGELTLLLATRHNERAAAIAPDGTLFAYVSDQDGNDEVYLRRYPDTGQEWHISTAGGFGPVWSRDGSELFYRQGDAIMSVSIAGSGAALRIGSPQERFRNDHLYLDRFGNPNFDVAPDGSLIIPLIEPSDVRTRVVLNLRPL